MILGKILIGIFSLLLLMVGADKFLNFLQPPCSLMETINPMMWMVLGGIQMLGAILIWLPKYRKLVANFFLGFMAFFTAYHLIKGTYDIGGAVFMLGLCALIVWSPAFLMGPKTNQ